MTDQAESTEQPETEPEMAPEEVAEAKAEEAAAEEEKKGPIVLSEVDRLKAENVNLRLLNAVNRVNLAQHALREAGRVRDECNQEVLKLRKALEDQYGIDFRTHEVDERSGIVTPRQPANLQALMGGRG